MVDPWNHLDLDLDWDLGSRVLLLVLCYYVVLVGASGRLTLTLSCVCLIDALYSILDRLLLENSPHTTTTVKCKKSKLGSGLPNLTAYYSAGLINY